MAISVATTGAAQLERAQLARALVASGIGTTIEYYDFTLYNLMAALVLGPLFFPSRDALASTLAVFGTVWVGFLARPIGAAIAGHFGDRIGRKAALVGALVVMGGASCLIGLVPTYAQIGIWGGILLVVLRFVQGLGISGEWGGAVLLAVEWGNRGNRGLYGSLPQLGLPAGLLLAYAAVSLTSLAPGVSWAWRLPFLFSAVLAAVGLYIRLGILETPVFAEVRARRRVERWPLLELLRQSWRQLGSASLVAGGGAAASLIFTTFVLTYATARLRIPQLEVLRDVLIGSTVSLASILFWGRLSDAVGRKRMWVAGSLTLLVFIPIYWRLLDSRVGILVLLAIVLSMVIRDMQNGPLAAFLAETFTGRLRYSGAGLAFGLSSAGSGAVPLIATQLLRTFHSSGAIAAFMAAVTLVTLLGSIGLRDGRARDLAAEYDSPLP
jgi:MFS family permease